MMLNVHIEPSRPELVESFHDCLDSVARERQHLAFDQAPPLEQMRLYVAEGLEKGMVQYFAIDGENVVGWCDIRRAAREIQSHAGTLGMGIRTGYRGQGLGSRLVKCSLTVAWSSGFTRVGLDVFAANKPAIALYRKFGFEHEGVKVNGRLVNGVYDDIVAMGLLRND